MALAAPQLGPLLVLTDRTGTDRPLDEVVRACADAGASAVVLREKDLPRDERRALAERLLRDLGPARLIVASDGELARELGVGVHLARAEVPSGPRAGIVGISCHDDAELARAVELGADYATLSPVHPSPSKPGHGPALGPEALADRPLPVYALGGIVPGRAAACIAAGAAGVAVMGAAMRDPRVVNALLREIEAARRPTS